MWFITKTPANPPTDPSCSSCPTSQPWSPPLFLSSPFTCAAEPHIVVHTHKHTQHCLRKNSRETTVNSDPPILSRTMTPSIPFFPSPVSLSAQTPHTQPHNEHSVMEGSLHVHCTAELCLWPSLLVFLSPSISLCGSVLPAILLAPVCRSPGPCILRVMMLEHTLLKVYKKSLLKWSLKNSDVFNLVQCGFVVNTVFQNRLQRAPFLCHSFFFLCHPSLLLISMFPSKWLTTNSFFSHNFVLSVCYLPLWVNVLMQTQALCYLSHGGS